MGTDNIHHKRKAERLERTRKKKNVLPYILIVSEGAVTEPNYFGWYKKNCKQFINVEIFGEGKNTSSLVREAIAIRNKIQSRENIVFDQVWCVFDKDSFTDSDYNNAFLLCGNENIQVAYSNECFELWYLLHFHYYNTGMDRQLIYTKLNELFKERYGFKYEKNMQNIFEMLRPLQAGAIKRARSLEKNCTNIASIHNQNPSTRVFKLVEELNKYVR